MFQFCFAPSFGAITMDSIEFIVTQGEQKFHEFYKVPIELAYRLGSTRKYVPFGRTEQIAVEVTLWNIAAKMQSRNDEVGRNALKELEPHLILVGATTLGSLREQAYSYIENWSRKYVEKETSNVTEMPKNPVQQAPPIQTTTDDSKPHWSYTTAMRDQGLDKWGNLVFHVPWIITNKSSYAISHPGYDIPDLPPTELEWNMRPQESSWLWDRLVVSSQPLNPDGRLHFFELILGKDHVPGQWNQQQYLTDIIAKRPQHVFAVRETAYLEWATREFAKKFGSATAALALPSTVLAWIKAGRPNNFTNLAPEAKRPTECKHTPQQMEAARKNPLEKALGYPTFCLQQFEQMIRDDAREGMLGEGGVVVIGIGETIAANPIAQTITQQVGEITGTFKPGPEDSAVLFPNAWDVNTIAILLAASILVFVAAKKVIDKAIDRLV